MIVGFSVYSQDDIKGDRCHGLLWYDRESAEEEAKHFTEKFSKEYLCSPLKINWINHQK